MSASRPTSAEEIFAIRRGAGRSLLYAPLRRSVAEVNDAAVAAVARYLDTGPEALEPADAAVIEALEAGGFLAGPAPRRPRFPKGYAFRPHEVTLFLTSRCNLRCRYCYADAGHKSVDMAWDTAKAAIDLVSRNAGLLGSSKFGVGFHGGGEPTVAWDMMRRCVEHARDRAEATGIDAEIYTATNGVLTDAQRDYICEHFTSVNVSLDGPADIQDRNRPKASGGGSYADAAESLRRFADARVHCGVRTTVTAESVGRLTEIVEELAGGFRLEYLQLEPVWECSRCATTGERPPSDDEFIEAFKAAAARGRELGMDVSYSGARLGVLTSKFCAAPGDGFAVLPEGTATSCFEVTEADDPRAAVFHYGAFDAVSGEFAFDADRLAALAGMSVEHLGFCDDCFCKWHCAGDCLAKVFDRSGSTEHHGSPRCDLNRALTLAGLEQLVSDGTAQDGAGGGAA